MTLAMAMGSTARRSLARALSSQPTSVTHPSVAWMPAIGAKTQQRTSDVRSAPRWSYLPILNLIKGAPEVHAITPGASIHRAAIDMVKHRTGSLIVKTTHGAMAGIVTERDILEKLTFREGEARTSTVSRIMTPVEALVTAPPSATLDRCAELMKSGAFRHMPIVEAGELMALISQRDIAAQGSASLSKAPMPAPPSVQDLIDTYKAGPNCLAVHSDCSVAEAVQLMRAAHAGSVLVADEVAIEGCQYGLGEGTPFGLFTERDYLAKVAVYDERPATEIPITEVRIA